MAPRSTPDGGLRILPRGNPGVKWPPNPAEPRQSAYARRMWFFIFLAVIAVFFVAYRLRVPLLAKLLGQSESRVNRRINRKH